jgi:hypothetical protein
LGGEAGRQPAFCGLLSAGPVSLAQPPLSYQPPRALALTAARTGAAGLQYLQTRLGLGEPEMAAPLTWQKLTNHALKLADINLCCVRQWRQDQPKTVAAARNR